MAATSLCPKPISCLTSLTTPWQWRGLGRTTPCLARSLFSLYPSRSYLQTAQIDWLLLLFGLSLSLKRIFWATSENLGNTMCYKGIENTQHRSFSKELCLWVRERHIINGWKPRLTWTKFGVELVPPTVFLIVQPQQLWWYWQPNSKVAVSRTHSVTLQSLQKPHHSLCWPKRCQDPFCKCPVLLLNIYVQALPYLGCIPKQAIWKKNPALNTSSNGVVTASPGILLQCLTTIIVKNFFLLSILNLLSFNLKPFPTSPIPMDFATVQSVIRDIKSSGRHNTSLGLDSMMGEVPAWLI